MTRWETDAVLEFVRERIALAARSPEGIIVLVCTAFLLVCIAVLLTIWVTRRVGSKRKEKTPPAMPTDTMDPLEVALQALRLKHAVRPLGALDETLGLRNLPDGIYGFTYLPVRTDCPVLKAKAPELFEVHKTAGGKVLVVGFVSPEVISAATSAAERFDLVLYSSPTEGASAPVSIPLSHVMRYRQRRAGQENILEMCVESAGAESEWEWAAASRKPPGTDSGVRPQEDHRAAG